MNSNRKSSLVKFAALALLAGCFSGRVANAQATYAGTFTLPFEARWGQAVLVPGEYSFTVDRATGGYMVTVRGEGKAAMIIGLAESDQGLSGQNHLTAVRLGMGYRIRSLEMTDLGTTVFFGLPKAEGQVMAQVPVLIRHLPVAQGGK